MPSTVLYIGALWDTTPLTIFESVESFVFIDQMPEDRVNHFSGNYKLTMKANFKRHLKKCGKILKADFSKTPWEFEVENKETKIIQHIVYHVNTVFPDEVPFEMVKDCEIMYDKGLVLRWDFVAKNWPQIKLIVGGAWLEYDFFSFLTDHRKKVTNTTRKLVMDYILPRYYFMKSKEVHQRFKWPRDFDIEQIKRLISEK